MIVIMDDISSMHVTSDYAILDGRLRTIIGLHHSFPISCSLGRHLMITTGVKSKVR